MKSLFPRAIAETSAGPHASFPIVLHRTQWQIRCRWQNWTTRFRFPESPAGELPRQNAGRSLSNRFKSFVQSAAVREAALLRRNSARLPRSFPPAGRPFATKPEDERLQDTKIFFDMTQITRRTGIFLIVRAQRPNYRPIQAPGQRTSSYQLIRFLIAI